MTELVPADKFLLEVKSLGPAAEFGKDGYVLVSNQDNTQIDAYHIEWQDENRSSTVKYVKRLTNAVTTRFARCGPLPINEAERIFVASTYTQLYNLFGLVNDFYHCITVAHPSLSAPGEEPHSLIEIYVSGGNLKMSNTYTHLNPIRPVPNDDELTHVELLEVGDSSNKHSATVRFLMDIMKLKRSQTAAKATTLHLIGSLPHRGFLEIVHFLDPETVVHLYDKVRTCSVWARAQHANTVTHGEWHKESKIDITGMGESDDSLTNTHIIFSDVEDTNTAQFVFNHVQDMVLAEQIDCCAIIKQLDLSLLSSAVVSEQVFHFLSLSSSAHSSESLLCQNMPAKLVAVGGPYERQHLGQLKPNDNENVLCCSMDKTYLSDESVQATFGIDMNAMSGDKLTCALPVSTLSAADWIDDPVGLEEMHNLLSAAIVSRTLYPEPMYRYVKDDVYKYDMLAGIGGRYAAGKTIKHLPNNPYVDLKATLFQTELKARYAAVHAYGGGGVHVPEDERETLRGYVSTLHLATNQINKLTSERSPLHPVSNMLLPQHYACLMNADIYRLVTTYAMRLQACGRAQHPNELDAVLIFLTDGTHHVDRIKTLAMLHINAADAAAGAKASVNWDIARKQALGALREFTTLAAAFTEKHPDSELLIRIRDYIATIQKVISDHGFRNDSSDHGSSHGSTRPQTRLSADDRRKIAATRLREKTATITEVDYGTVLEPEEHGDTTKGGKGGKGRKAKKLKGGDDPAKEKVELPAAPTSVANAAAATAAAGAAEPDKIAARRAKAAAKAKAKQHCLVTDLEPATGALIAQSFAAYKAANGHDMPEDQKNSVLAIYKKKK